MNQRWSVTLLAWITRVIAVLFVILNGIAWWDESQTRQDPTLGGSAPGDWFWQWAVLTHLLPLAFIAAATALGWWMPAYGALGFLIFATAQAVSVGAEWIYLPLVVLPPLLVAILFFVGWLIARGGSRRQNT